MTAASRAGWPRPAGWPTSPDGSLTGARKEQILGAVDVKPSFNLFTAYIALRDEPTDTPYGRALFEKTRAFIAARKCRDVEPGTREARNCESGPLAPYNLQAATVMLGDQFLRQGEDALRRGASPEAMEWLGTADGVYATLSTDRHRAGTAAWSKAPLLEIRKKRVAAFRPGAPRPDDGLALRRVREHLRLRRLPRTLIVSEGVARIPLPLGERVG